MVGGFILVTGQIKGVRQLGQLGRYLFGTYKAEKEEWEKNKASQPGSAPQVPGTQIRAGAPSSQGRAGELHRSARSLAL